MGLKLKFKLPVPKVPPTTTFVKKSQEELMEEQERLKEEQRKAALAKIEKPAPVAQQIPLSQRKKGKKYYRVHTEWAVSKYRCTWTFPVGHEIEVLERSQGWALVNFYPNTLTLKVVEGLLDEYCTPL